MIDLWLLLLQLALKRMPPMFPVHSSGRCSVGMSMSYLLRDTRDRDSDVPHRSIWDRTSLTEICEGVCIASEQPYVLWHGWEQYSMVFSFILRSVLVETCWNQRSFDLDVCASADASMTVRQVADDELSLDIQ